MTLLALLCFVYFGAQLVGMALLIHRMPQLEDVAAPVPGKWPRLSVIVPARNEAGQLETALRSKLAEGYPDLELIAIDDRSTDATGEIIDKLAAEDPRVVAVHVRELPQGWLGKLHAMQRGVERATGDFLLFSDADIHFKPGVLQRAIALCEHRHVDHLALLPSIHPISVLLDATLVAFFRFICLAGRLWKVNQPGAKEAMGVGAFNLVRRSCFDRTPGLQWLKLEVADDVGLGQMMKRAGGSGMLVGARSWLGLEFYASLGQMMAVCERSGAAFHFLAWPVVLAASALAVLELAPILAIATGTLPAVLLGAAALLANALVAVLNAVFADLPRGRAFLLAPVGTLILLFLMANGAIRAARRQGLSWRDTHYTAAELLAGRRITL